MSSHIRPDFPQPPLSGSPPHRDDADVGENQGMPRCYFCGKRFTSEAEIKKIKHNIGNNYHIYVFICRSCEIKGVSNASSGCLVMMVIGVLALISTTMALAGW